MGIGGLDSVYANGGQTVGQEMIVKINLLIKNQTVVYSQTALKEIPVNLITSKRLVD